MKRMPAKPEQRTIKASELDALFDAGESVANHLDRATAERPNLEPMRVNVDFPRATVAALDREAARIGISRQALIKLWIADKLGAVRAA